MESIGSRDKCRRLIFIEARDLELLGITFILYVNDISNVREAYGCSIVELYSRLLVSVSSFSLNSHS